MHKVTKNPVLSFGMFNPDPGFEFFPSLIPDQKDSRIPAPDTKQENKNPGTC
jgi:hypothetical protein